MTDYDEDGSALPDDPRRVPYSADVESSLLGAAMLSTKALEVFAMETTPADFYVPKHRTIAHALAHAFAAGEPTDLVSLADALDRAGLLEQVGGPPGLIDVQSATASTSAASVLRYATIIHDYATRRRLIATGERIAAAGYEREDAHAAVTRAHELLGDVAAQNGARSYSGLEVADVAAVIDGGLEPDEADFLTRSDGRALIYAGKMHMLQAEPSSGKSWIALATAMEVLDAGGSVVYLDYEDAAKGILGRLLALGADPDAVRERFRYAQIVGGFGVPERTELFALLADLNADLVVIDGVAEALTRDGLSEDSATDYVSWIEKLPRPVAKTGAAVLLLDHVAKDPEARGRWARGTGAKLGAIDGAAYHVKVASAFSRRRAGIVRLIIAKDRPGGVGSIGETAAIGHVEPHADGVRVVIRLEPDTGERSIADKWKPSILMRRVSEELARSGQPMMAKTLRSLVHSEKPKLLEEAIGRLEQEGYIQRTKLGRAVAYEHVRPFLEDDPPPAKSAGAPPEPPVDDAPPDLFHDAVPDPEPATYGEPIRDYIERTF